MEKPLKVETVIVHGHPDRALIEESREAAMICLGSAAGEGFTRMPVGSTAAALAEQAQCPSIRTGGRPHPDSGWIAAAPNDEPHNDAVVHHAMQEGRLRQAPALLLDGRIDSWIRRYPDVHPQTVAERPGATGNVEHHGQPMQLTVVGDVDHLARPVVVGVDGSRAAVHAALWAVDEAINRDIPLRLVSVINPVGISGAHADAVQDASARAALYEARRAIEATGKPVKIESEVLWGKPLAALIEQTRWAVMVCIGSIGLKHACDGAGSVAAGLAGPALCPLAVIRRPVGRSATPRGGSIVVDVHNGVVLRHAFEEARLRGAPLRAISVSRTEGPDDVGDGDRLAQAQMNRRIARWTRLYPDVQVESVIVRGSVCRYLATNADSVQLFVADPQAYRDLRKANDAGCSVLTVRCTYL